VSREGSSASLTHRGLRVVDVTAEVERAIAGSGVADGLACVYSTRTTCVVRVNEVESGLLDDFARLLDELVPEGDSGRRGALLAMLVGPAGELVPVSEGRLALGRWQRVLLISFADGPEPEWLVRVVGV
jgi:secondary thiamine-phosphate synthase enzyme